MRKERLSQEIWRIKRHFVCAKHLVKSWQDTIGFFEWPPPSSRQQCNSIQKEFKRVSSRLFYCQGKEELRPQFNRMFRMGVVELGNIVNMYSQHFIEFDDAFL